jgi:hypothetical protein
MHQISHMVNGVHGVEDVLTIWMIQDEGVCCVEVGDDGDQGGACQRFMRGITIT